MGALLVFFVAVLSGLGIGSGGLYLLYLTDVLGVGQYAAQGQNLAFFVLATLASSILHLRRGHVTLGELSPFLAAGLVGTLLGSFLTSVTPPALARRAFGGVMIAGGAVALFRALFGTRGEKEKKSSRRRA